MKFTRIFPAVVIVTLTVFSFGQLWAVGGSMAIFLITYSSICIVIGMRSGMENAPAENWNRETTRVQSVLILTLLWTLISIPAVVVGVFLGVMTGISSLWVTFIVIGTASKLMVHWFGPLENFKADRTIAKYQDQ